MSAAKARLPEGWAEMTAVQRAPIIRQASRVLARARREQPGLFSFVYAIQAGEGGPIKIGVSDRPATRLQTLQQANAETLIPLAAWHTPKVEEKQLHEEFAYARIRGEWFRPVPELVELVIALGGDFEDWAS